MRLGLDAWVALVWPVVSLCSYVTRWHGAVSALIESAGMRTAKRARPSFEKFSTTILLALFPKLVGTTAMEIQRY